MLSNYSSRSHMAATALVATLALALTIGQPAHAAAVEASHPGSDGLQLGRRIQATSEVLHRLEKRTLGSARRSVAEHADPLHPEEADFQRQWAGARVHDANIQARSQSRARSSDASGSADRARRQQYQQQQGQPEMSYMPNLTRDKWIGLGLAISSSLAIGTSFIITKKGLIDAADRVSGLASDDHSYLQNPIWWAGMATMIVGEVANFAAYTFAPPILVTPLGALSVLIGAVLASFILKEELGRLGRVGCALCLVGTLIIILNAPEDKEIKTVDEILNYALQPGFMLYCISVLCFSVWMIYRVVPKYGKRTPLVYISICSSVGSISVMSVKGFGVALKLTLDGNNQFTHPSTYCFALVVVVCILVQMNYFNKALDQFSTNVVNPIYYVMFTTSTIFASFLLFRGFNTEGAAPAVSLLCGFIVIFLGVYLLNLNRLIDPVTQQPRMSLVTGEGVPAGRLSDARDRFLHGDSGLFNPRLSMSQQRAGGYGQLPQHRHDGRRGSAYADPFTIGHSAPSRRSRDMSGHTRRGSDGSSVLFNAYDHDEAVGLTRLNEHSDEEEDDDGGSGKSKKSKQQNGRASGEGSRAKSHARSISLKLPDNLAEGRVKNSPVLATSSTVGGAPGSSAGNGNTPTAYPAGASKTNLLGIDD